MSSIIEMASLLLPNETGRLVSLPSPVEMGPGVVSFNRGQVLVTLTHERQHLDAELREMGETAFPLDQFAPELPLERLDCPGGRAAKRRILLPPG
jgi:hypothetical protein